MNRLGRAVRSIERRLRTLPIDGSAPHLAIDQFQDTFRTFLWVAHRLERNADGVGFAPAFLEHRGLSADGQAGYLKTLTKPMADGPLVYDPDRPSAEQRNRAFALDDLYRVVGRSHVDAVRSMLTSIGLEFHDQLRIVVCDGPQLLGWVGGYREEPFTNHEKRALQRLVPALRISLLWRRRLSAAGIAAGFDAAMEAIGGAAFLMDAKGAIAYANKLGRGLLAEQRPSTRDDLRNALFDRGAESMTVRAAGLADHSLVVLRTSSAMLQRALDRAAIDWTLTRRQREVLAHLASGDTNKGIATKLGCAEVTVELHVTALLRRSRTATRGELAASLWRFATCP